MDEEKGKIINLKKRILKYSKSPLKASKVFGKSSVALGNLRTLKIDMGKVTQLARHEFVRKVHKNRVTSALFAFSV